MTLSRRGIAVCAVLTAVAVVPIAAQTAQKRTHALDIAGAKAEIDKFRKIPAFVAPGPAFDAKKAAAGKTLFIIPANSNIPFVTTIADGMVAQAGRVGLKANVFQNQGSPAEWQQGLNAAISQKASAIDLLAGIDPALVKPQIQAASEAKIPVTVSHLYDLKQASAPGVPISAVVNIPYNQAGKLLANWVIWKTKGKGNALVLTINQVSSTKPMVAGIEGEFKKRCPACKWKKIDSTITDLGKLQAKVQSALTADKSVNYVIALYDSAEAPQAEAAIKALNRGATTKIVTFNGTASILKTIKPGSIIEMDVAENLDWIARGIIDQELRQMAGLPASKNPGIPIRIVTAANVREFGNPPADGKGFGNTYAGRYDALWGLK